MRFIATADFHLGEELQGLDRFGVLEQIFAFGINKQVSFIIVCGDIYDHLMVSNSVRARFNRLIKQSSDKVEIILFPGNHDEGRKVSSLSPLLPFVDKRINIITRPSVFKREGKRFLVLPYNIKDNSSEKNMKKIFRKYAGDYHCVFAHLSISGVKTGPSNFTLLSGVSKTTLRKYFNSDYFILGHIHKPQKSGNIYYCGSPDYLDFGERNEEKRFLYYKDGSIISIPIKNKQLVQVELTPDGINGDIIKDAIYKIVVRCNKREIRDIDIKGVSEKIKEVGGSIIKTSWDIISKSRIRVKEINFRDSLLVNAKKYIKRFGGDECRELMIMAEGIFNEAERNRNK